MIKYLELRDKATFIPVMAVEIKSQHDQEKWLIKKAGFDPDSPCILLMPFGMPYRGAHYFPAEWNDRTYMIAHRYIYDNWKSIQCGDVICVEYILGERETPKQSERLINEVF